MTTLLYLGLTLLLACCYAFLWALCKAAARGETWDRERAVQKGRDT